MSAFTIPVFNILAVIALTMYVTDDKAEGETVNAGAQIKKTLIGIAKNPLIHGVLAGVVVVLTIVSAVEYFIRNASVLAEK